MKTQKKVTFTISQKQSGTGSIYDLSSQHYDIHIEFDDEEFAVIYPSYFEADIKYFESEEDLIDYMDDDDNDTKYAVIVNRYGDLLDYHSGTLYDMGEKIEESNL